MEQQEIKPRLGKRSIGNFNADKTIRDAYKLYVKKFVNLNTSKYSESVAKEMCLSWKDYKEVVTKMLSKIMDRILYKSETFHVPFRLGIIRIQKKKMNIANLKKDNNLKIDWGHYQKTGKKIYHLNEHRDYNRYGFYWLCIKGPIGKNSYRFNALRERDRELKTILKTTQIDYFN